jgi:hypothetical protein
VVESPAEVETRGGFVIQMGSPTFYWDDGERLSDFFFLFDSDQCFFFFFFRNTVQTQALTYTRIHSPL